MFAVELQILRQAGQNDIEVQLADDGNIEFSRRVRHVNRE